MTEQGILRRRHEVLADFSEIMHRYDPMGTESPNEDEYEGEALSILSRFTEHALQQSDDEQAAFSVAAGIVTQCLNFWFDEDVSGNDLTPLTLELLTVYVESFPKSLEVADEKLRPEGVV